LDELLPFTPKERINRFSCGHIIPESSLLTLAISSGPSGQPLQLTVNNRSKDNAVNEIGQIIINLCNVVKDGMIVFFASYEYMDLVIRRWKVSGMLQKIEAKKKVSFIFTFLFICF